MPKKQQMSAEAEAIAIDRLTKWAAAGHDPNEIVRTSIMSGWVGLFEPKTGGGKGRLSKTDEFAARQEAAYWQGRENER